MLAINKKSSATNYLMILALTLLLIVPFVNAQTPSGSNLWIGQLVKDGNELLIEDLKQITKNNAYTNQPYFLDEDTLLYTQAIDDESISASEQTDIFQINLINGDTSNITNSSTSEYSPTPMPELVGLSVIRVNESGKQELWQLDLDGKPIRNLLPKIEPVGYHVWINQHELMLFVLGEPHKLVRADVRQPSSLGEVLDSNPGPSLFNIPNSKFFSYTQKKSSNSEEPWRLKIQSFANPSSIVVDSVSLPHSAYYYAWSHHGDLLTSDNGQLVAMDLSKNDRRFRTVKGACKTSVSRIAVSALGKIALVCSE